MPTYAVTAATGHLGRLVLDALLERGAAPADVAAVVRTPARAADLAERGFDVREGDYSRPETLPAALAGVERLLLISGSEVGRRVAQHTAVLDAAREAGVASVAYTSILRGDASPLPLAAEHVATEEALRASGLPTTVLRNGWYVENYTAQLPQLAAAGELVAAVGDARVSAAPRADYAQAAAAVLTGSGHEGAVYELAGPAATYAELAEALSRAAGTPIAYRAVSGEELTARLTAAGLDEGTAGFVAALDAGTAEGTLADTSTGDLRRLIGRPTTPLVEGLRDALAAA